MSKEMFNPPEGRDCLSCAYIENKQGTAHKGCKRDFTVGKYLSATLSNETTGRIEKVAVYIDSLTAKMIASGKATKKEWQIACTIRINKWTKMFPLDFDPTWVVACIGWSTELDEHLVKKRSPLEEMIGILGSVGRI